MAPAPQDWSGLGSERTYPQCAELIRQGRLVTEAMIVVEGLAKLVRVAASGRELIVGMEGRGAILGAGSLILGTPAPANVETVTRCRVREIPGPEFVRLVRSDKELTWRVLCRLAETSGDQVQRIAELGLESSRLRLERFLWRLATDGHGLTDRGSVRLALPLRHYEVANLLGMTPEHLSRLFHAMVEERVIQFDRGWLVIPDPQRLRAGAPKNPKSSATRAGLDSATWL